MLPPLQRVLLPVLLLQILLPVFVTWDCYDTKCRGALPFDSIYIDCDNRYSQCSEDLDGRPRCVYHGKSGDGVNCPENFECTSDKTTGKASCAGLWDCYDNKCRGRERHSSSYIYCNSRWSFCTVHTDGYPKCVSTATGAPAPNASGVSCGNRPIDCGWDPETGAAFCRNYWECYDKKCRGEGYFSDEYIGCDNRYNYCSTTKYGLPECRVYSHACSGRGNGVDCDSAKQNCKWNDYTGVASCGEKDFPRYELIAVTVIVFCLVLQLLCCVLYRKYSNVTRNLDVELVQEPSADGNQAPAVFLNPTAIDRSEANHPENAELSVCPPPNYEEHLPSHIQQAPPSYEECVANADKL